MLRRPQNTASSQQPYPALHHTTLHCTLTTRIFILLAKESLVKDQTPTPTETTTESETKAHRHRAIALLFRMMVKVMQVFLCCALLVSTVLAQAEPEGGSPDSDNNNPDRSGGGNGNPGDNLPPATDVDEIDVQSCNLTIGYYVSFFLFLRSSKYFQTCDAVVVVVCTQRKTGRTQSVPFPVARFIYPGANLILTIYCLAIFEFFLLFCFVWGYTRYFHSIYIHYLVPLGSAHAHFICFTALHARTDGPGRRCQTVALVSRSSWYPKPTLCV
jgi:hypothetical protein